MNPFEKIYNYRIVSRLDESEAVALTAQERAWLAIMLEHGAAGDAFAPDTLRKLRQLLQSEDRAEFGGALLEKAKSRERQVYHPLLRPLRRMILNGQGVRLTFRLKHGGVKADASGLPYKLEYSMVKREWYLLWYSGRGRSLMATKLSQIVAASETPIAAGQAAELRERIAQLLEERRRHAVVEVVRTYNAELSRILYAFSCFDKTVDYDEEANLYRIRVAYLADESEFLLSRIRFLGLRVRIVEGEDLRRRMLESADKAIARYET